MQLVFVLLTLLLLAVAVFAFQNPEPVTVKFLAWQVSSSVAVVTVGSATGGALIAVLLSLIARLRRWSRTQGVARPGPEATEPDETTGRPTTPPRAGAP